MDTTLQVALLRGVNVGRHQRIEMAGLRELLTDLGYGHVRTHLNSGNAVFTNTATAPERAGRDIQDAIAVHLGLTVPVLVRTAAELAAVVAADPLAGIADNPSRYLVAFLSAAPEPGLTTGLDPAAYAPEVFHFGDREIYLWLPDGVIASRIGHTFWEKRLNVTATARNWNTVTRLATLAAG
ncbi:MAG TPA: DUF1697 domain-containing protein [Mycobacteriales bacterium]|nr:DUF1697 domain-containing protein [Mycobacteriales bacterium]